MTPTQKAELARLADHYFPVLNGFNTAMPCHDDSDFATVVQGVRALLTENAELEKVAGLAAMWEANYEAQRLSNVDMAAKLAEATAQVAALAECLQAWAKEGSRPPTEDVAATRRKSASVLADLPASARALLDELKEAKSQVAALTTDRDEWKRVGEYENRRAVEAESALAASRGRERTAGTYETCNRCNLRVDSPEVVCCSQVFCLIRAQAKPEAATSYLNENIVADIVKTEEQS